ncbi:hypothetical protein BWQ96_05333 [Gracilariopsis chorda]|uniref:Uncharacterized protein n=1 Tax=Gracilariopsis chorda TaxID=448386 RepID=A0A2V3IS18_9FLOR|nr:hypothetical protein BWQ96_05333 [Gracilariopsis chorda]|eukprot:PXF44913.1 hypothetical protein BWQ96_05333 [Gracilariopsis chorda]
MQSHGHKLLPETLHQVYEDSSFVAAVSEVKAETLRMKFASAIAMTAYTLPTSNMTTLHASMSGCGSVSNRNHRPPQAKVPKVLHLLYYCPDGTIVGNTALRF